MCLEAEVDCVSSEASQAPLCVGTATQRLRILKCSIDVLNSGTVSRFIHLYGQVWGGVNVELSRGVGGVNVELSRGMGGVNVELSRGVGGVNIELSTGVEGLTLANKQV